MVKSACGIEAVYMCFNGTGIWGGETLSTQNPTWLPYWLALLAQMPLLSDVQLLFHMGI